MWVSFLRDRLGFHPNNAFVHSFSGWFAVVSPENRHLLLHRSKILIQSVLKSAFASWVLVAKLKFLVLANLTFGNGVCRVGCQELVATVRRPAGFEVATANGRHGFVRLFVLVSHEEIAVSNTSRLVVY